MTLVACEFTCNDKNKPVAKQIFCPESSIQQHNTLAGLLRGKKHKGQPV